MKEKNALDQARVKFEAGSIQATQLAFQACPPFPYPSYNSFAISAAKDVPMYNEVVGLKASAAPIPGENATL